MATTTHREGPPSPGAGLPRLTHSSRKALRLAGLVGLLVILVLTFDKTVFFFRLTGAALGSGTGGRGYFTALAKCAYRRPALLPLLEDEAGAPDFLAAWLAEHVRRGDSDFEKNGYGPFLERVSAWFPENVLLESLGIYDAGENRREWQAFDPLFFRLVSDPGFNGLSYPALTRAFLEGRLPPESLPPLLSYLAWMKNPALAKELREWGTGDPAAKNALSGITRSGLWSRPAVAPQPGPRGGAAGARSALAKALGIDPAPLRLGENLIAGPDLSDVGSFERSWEFLNLSGRDPFAKGSFAGGLDPQAGPALRVMGFFAKAQPGRVPSRAGFGQKRAIPLDPEIYLFAFRYRAESGAERPSFWLSSSERLPEREIAPAGEAWRRVLYLFRNAELALPEVKPLLRMWGTGTVWFDDVGLYAVEAGGPFPPTGREALFYE